MSISVNSTALYSVGNASSTRDRQAPQSGDSLFQQTLKGLQGQMQGLLASGDTRLSIENASLSAYSAGKSPIMQGALVGGGNSMTIQGTLSETRMINGSYVTEENAFKYTQFETLPNQKPAVLSSVFEVNRPLSDLTQGFGSAPHAPSAKPVTDNTGITVDVTSFRGHVSVSVDVNSANAANILRQLENPALTKPKAALNLS